MAGTILCVDDDRNLCQILAAALTSEGYAVTKAYDGDAAIAAVQEKRPDLMLLDLVLPRRDGFAVLEALRALDGPAADTPTLILSGCTPTEQSRDRARALAVPEMLTKPIPLDDLLEVVARCIGEHKEPVAVRADSPARKEREPGLTGGLDRVPFPELLHHLHGLRTNGVLHLASGRKRKWLALRDGYPSSIRSNLVNECLGNFLVRGGQISQATMAESRRRMKPGRLQGEVLVAMEILSEEEVADSLRAQADEKLLELFAWETGTYQFESGDGVSKGNSFGVVASPANLILRGVRERYPLARVEKHLQSYADCLVSRGESPYYEFQEIDLDSEQEALLGRLDGRARLSSFQHADSELKRTLYALYAVGLLELHSGAVKPERQAPRRGTRPVPRTEPTSKPQTAAQRPQPQPRGNAEDEQKRARLTLLAERLSSQSHFEVLGVDESASEAETRAAYERVAEKMHPDRFSNSSRAVQQMAERVFSQITGAYQTLADPKRREEYVLNQRQQQRETLKEETSQRALEAEKEFQKGEQLFASRAYEKALACFGRALELYPDEGEYYAHYGYTLHMCHPDDASMAEEAIEHVMRGIKLAGHREKSYLFLGRLYKAIGRPGTAERMFTRAVQIHPESVEALRELRLINMRRHKSKGLIGRIFGR
jgi:CheY-like chemotaxis protein